MKIQKVACLKLESQIIFIDGQKEIEKLLKSYKPNLKHKITFEYN